MVKRINMDKVEGMIRNNGYYIEQTENNGYFVDREDRELQERINLVGGAEYGV